MRTIPVYREPMLILPYELCQWSPCMNDSTICGCYEGVTATGDAIFCSLDSTEAV